MLVDSESCRESFLSSHKNDWIRESTGPVLSSKLNRKISAKQSQSTLSFSLESFSPRGSSDQLLDFQHQ